MVEQVFRLIALIVLVGNFGLIWALQDQAAPVAQTPADKTKINQRDRDKRPLRDDDRSPPVLFPPPSILPFI